MNAIAANRMASLAMMTGSTVTVNQSRCEGGSCFLSTPTAATLSTFPNFSKISTKTSNSRHQTNFFPARSWIDSFGDNKTFEADHSKETFKTVIRGDSIAKEDSQPRKANGYRPKIPREKNPIRLSSSASPRIVLNTYQIIWYPLITEATMKEMTKNNTIVFVVDKGANKDNIKDAARTMFGIETKKVNTLITYDGQKKAFLMLKPNHNALEIAKQIKAL